MTWAKFDDMLPSNRKWRRLVKRSPEAACLWVAAICYSARYLTDGRIAKDEIEEVGPFRQPEKLAALLVDENMFEDDEDAWWVHDYLVHNPSAESILAKREEDRERKAKQRTRGSKAVVHDAAGRFVRRDVRAESQRTSGRSHSGRPGGVPSAVREESQGVSPATRPVPSRPVPSSSSPNPLGDDDVAPPGVVEEEEISGSEEGLTAEDRQAVEAVSEEWLEWHRTRAEQGIRDPITDSTAWLDTDRRRRSAALVSGDRSVLDPPPVPGDGHRPDPLEASATAQRAIAERNEARLRGEFECQKCADVGVVETEGGVVERCDCVASSSKAAVR